MRLFAQGCPGRRRHAAENDLYFLWSADLLQESHQQVCSHVGCCRDDLLSELFPRLLRDVITECRKEDRFLMAEMRMHQVAQRDGRIDERSPVRSAHRNRGERVKCRVQLVMLAVEAGQRPGELRRRGCDHRPEQVVFRLVVVAQLGDEEVADLGQGGGGGSGARSGLGEQRADLAMEIVDEAGLDDRRRLRFCHAAQHIDIGIYIQNDMLWRIRCWVMRSYSSPRRQDAALATRTAILDSARRLFVARGYAEVTVEDIAAAARVAIPTIYSSTGGKAAILRALLAPVVDDPAVEQTLTGIAATDDPRKVIAITAAGTRQAQERHWELVWGLLHRNIAESSAAPVLDEAKRAYLDAMAAVADRLMALDALKPELDHAAAVDLLWFYLGRPGWYTLVGDRGWDFGRAEAWLAGAAQQALLR